MLRTAVVHKESTSKMVNKLDVEMYFSFFSFFLFQEMSSLDDHIVVTMPAQTSVKRQ